MSSKLKSIKGKPEPKLHWSFKDGEILKKGFYVWGIFSKLNSFRKGHLLEEEIYARRKDALKRKKEIIREIVGQIREPYFGKLLEVRKVFVKDGRK